MALHDGQGERDLLLLWESLHAQIALEKLRCMRARQVLDMHTEANPQTEMPCSTTMLWAYYILQCRASHSQSHFPSFL